MDLEHIKIISEIINNDEFQKRKMYHHHGEISVYEHSIKVMYLAYRIGKKFKNVDINSIIIGGILHDFYYDDWQLCTEKRPLFKKHGFVHAHEALLNAEKYFPHLMNDKVKNIIDRHMFPLNIVPPKYIEAWIVTLADKIVSFETFANPLFIFRLLGLKGN